MDKCSGQGRGKRSQNSGYTFQQLVARFRVSNPNRELPPQARCLAILREKLIQRELMIVRDLKFDLLDQLNKVKNNFFSRSSDVKNPKAGEASPNPSLAVSVSEERETKASLNQDQNKMESEFLNEVQKDMREMSFIFKSAIDAKIILLQQHKEAGRLQPEKTKRYQVLIHRYIQSLDYISGIAIQFLSRPCACSFTPPNPMTNHLNSASTNKLTRASVIAAGSPTPVMQLTTCDNEFHSKLTQLYPFFRGVEILQNYLVASEFFAYIIVGHLAWIYIFLSLKTLYMKCNLED